jgi:hypothetical protein
LKFRVFWDVAPCIQIDVDRRFRGAYCLHDKGDEIALMMEAVRTSETSVNINLTTRRYIPEESKLHTRRRENLKSHMVDICFEKTGYKQKWYKLYFTQQQTAYNSVLVFKCCSLHKIIVRFLKIQQVEEFSDFPPS